MGMAKQLYSNLRRYGLDVWLDEESFYQVINDRKEVRINGWDLMTPTNKLKN
jgi:hypothetical protein